MTAEQQGQDGQQGQGGAAAQGQQGTQGQGAQGQQGQQPAGFDWKGALGDKYGDHEKLLAGKGWKSPAEALTSYAGLEAMIGANRLAVPGKDAKPEDWDAFFAKAGRPEKADGYQFTKPEGFEGYDDAFAGTFREVAHKAGLLPQQAAALHDWWVEQSKGTIAKAQETLAASEAALNTEISKTWGDKSAERLELAKREAAARGVKPETVAALVKAVGNFQALDILADLGAGRKEGALVGGGGSMLTPEAAQAEVRRLEGDREFRAAFLTQNHPGHAEAVRRMTDLQLRANPNAVGQSPGRAA